VNGADGGHDAAERCPPMVLLVAVLAWDRLAVPNLLPAAVGVIALFVLFEKTMPWGDWMGRFTGLVLIGWGATDLIHMLIKWLMRVNAVTE